MKQFVFVIFFLFSAFMYLVTGCGSSDSGSQSQTSEQQISQGKFAQPQKDGWIVLFDGTDFNAWQMDKQNGWGTEDGTMAVKDGGYIWSKERFANFTLDLEFKVSTDCNSGVFFRTGNIKDAVQTGIEMQVLDSADKPDPDKHDCGALYDLLEPSSNPMKKAGEWNHVVITCNGNLITIVMNNTKIIDADFNKWTQPNKNPDGTDNKFNTALKDFPKEGHIGFQDHGHPVWYRNVKIKEL